MLLTPSADKGFSSSQPESRGQTNTPEVSLKQCLNVYRILELFYFQYEILMLFNKLKII